MKRSAVLRSGVVLSLLLAGCAAPRTRPLVDPFPLRFPLVEAGSLEIEGTIVGQPLARDGVVYFATSDGYRTAIVIPSRHILWRRSGQEAPDDPGHLPAREGPKPPILRAEGNRLEGLDGEGRSIWEFSADGRITADPAVSEGRLYFGTENRRFYCLKAGTGKAVWSRRLQGAPLHPAVIARGTVVLAASNSVVYFLSAPGGSILTWEIVPSRVVYPPAVAGPLVLVSSASRDVTALELETRQKAGQYLASGPLAAGAVWSSPYLVLFVEDAESGRQRIVFLRSR
jgi:outer membrane protein assembly factor BamB